MHYENRLENNLIVCKKHIDTNIDMLCDSCGNKLPLSNYVQEKIVEAISTDESVVKIAGNMPKDTTVESHRMNNEEATTLAQKYITDITSGDILYAYDISMLSNEVKYQPEDFNQVVKVKISNLDLEEQENLVLLHIIDENNYELLPLMNVTQSEIEFSATRFSTYIVITAETIKITAGSEVSSEIILRWDMEDGVKYTLQYADEEGTVTKLSENAKSPYTHYGLEENKIYEYTIIGYDEGTASNVGSGKIVAYTKRAGIYTLSEKDLTNPIVSNVTVTPSTGTIIPTSEVVVTFDITDDNYDFTNGSFLYPDDIQVLVNGLEATTAKKTLTESTLTKGERFTLTISNVWGEGSVSIKIPAGAITDLAFNDNAEYIIDTNLSAIRNILKPVTNVSASSGDSENSIIIKWTDTENVGSIKYVLEATKGEENWVTLSNSDATSYTHSGLTKNMSFEYRIKAVNDKGNESEYVHRMGRTEYDPTYTDIMIDTKKPQIGLVSINPEVDYVGVTQEIAFTFEATDDNYNSDLTALLDSSFIIKVAGNEISGVNRTLTKESVEKGERFILKLSNITSSGKVSIVIPEGVIIDSALNSNDEIEIDTGIVAMNGKTITTNAPTLVPDVHSISVTNNQISTIPISKIKYEYRMNGDTEFITWAETTASDTVITGLYSNVPYEVRTTVFDVAGNIESSEIAYTTTNKIDASAINFTHESREWTNLVAPNPEVVATIIWNDTLYIHQYSTDKVNWKTATGTTTDIEITEKVNLYARYSDGVGSSDPIEYVIENIDQIKPTIDSASIPEGKGNTKQILVSGIKDEGGSGLKGYYVSKIPDLSAAVWTLSAESKIEFTAKENIPYYVWVIDNAGNISEAKIVSVSGIVSKVSNINIDSEIRIKVFEKMTPELTYDGEPKNKTWEIIDTNIATVEADTGKITGKAAGETKIRITFIDYDGTITIKETKLIVEQAEAALKVNEPTEFSFIYGDEAEETTYTYEGTGAISISVVNGNIASAEIIDNRIIVTPGDAGETMVVISAAETEEYAGVSVNIPVTVAKRVAKLKWSDESFIYDGKQKVVNAVLENVAYSDIISISATGNKATVVGEYSATATKIVGTKAKNYTLENGENLTHTWKITKANRTVTGLPDSLNVIYKEPAEIKFTYVGDETTASAISSDSTIVEATYVDGTRSGTITLNALKAGNTTIIVTIPETDNYKIYTKTISTVAYPSNASVIVDIPEFTLTYGDSAVTTSYTYEGNGDISVESSDSNVATASINKVNKTVTITPKNAATEAISIKVKTTATAQYEASEAIIKVKVNPRVAILTWHGTTYVYDGTEKSVIVTLDNLVGTDNPGTVYTENMKTNAGKYTAKVTGFTNTNYTVQGSKNTSHSWEILKADINPTIEMSNYIYGGTKPTPKVNGNHENGTETFYVYNINSEDQIINWNKVNSSYYLEPGTYKMYATVAATANYNEGTTNIIQFKITMENIEVALTLNENAYGNQWTNKDIKATITVPTSVTEMESVYYKIGEDGSYEAYTNAKKEGNVVTITFNKNINGDIYFAAVNVGGKVLTNGNGPHLMRIDKNIPKIGTVNVTPVGASNSKYIEVSGITDTGESGIAGYYVGTESDTSKLTWEPLSEDNFTTRVYENGTYNIFVKDTAGNISVASTVTITSIVEKITNASVNQNLEVEVFKSIASGLKFSGDASEITYTFENPDIATANVTTGVITAKNAGETKITITIKNYDDDLSPVILETNLKVTKRQVGLTWVGELFVHDGSVKTVTATVTGARTQDTVYVSKYTDNEKVDVGKYTAVAEELNDKNYTLEGVTNITHNWEIIQGTLNPILVMGDYAYGGTKATPEIIGNDGNGEVTYYVYASDADVSTKINWNTVTSSTYLEPGVYMMYADIAESLNYKAATTETVSFEISLKNIKVELTQNGVPYDGNWSNTDVVATITVPEDVTTMSSIYYRLEDESEWRSDVTTTKNGNVVTLTFKNPINSKVSFIAVNTNGEHVTNESAMHWIKVDQIRPVIGNIISTPANTVISNRKTIEITNIVDEGGSGLVSYYVGLETELDKFIWEPLDKNNITVNVYEVGTYNVYVKDAAGNLSNLHEVEIENIVEKVGNITLPSEVQIEVFEKVTPELTFTGEAASITWTIDDDTIAKINATTGEITGAMSGETGATVTISDYDGTKTEVSLKVIVKAATPVFEIEDLEAFNFIYGDSVKETKFTYDGDGVLSLISEDENVVKVSRSGNKIVVTPIGFGTTIVKFSATETPYYAKVEKEITATVSARPVELTWSNDTFYYDGEEKEIIASVMNPVGNDIVRVIGYIDNKKTNAGTYTAIATTLNDSNYTLVGGLNVEKEWVINKGDRNLTFNPESIEIIYGTSGYVDFSYIGSANEVTATSNNADIAVAQDPEDVTNGNIKVDGIGRGTTTVKVTVSGDENYNTAEKEFTVNVLGADPELTVLHPEITITYGDVPTNTTYQYSGNATQDQMKVRTTNEYIATAVLTGNQIIITPTGAGRAKIILTAPETKQYNEMSAEITIIVKPRPVELTWSADEFIYDGTEKEVTATIDNIVGDDMVEISYSGNKETDAGEYTAEAIEIIGDRGKHYTPEGGSNVTHDWKILKGDREVTIDNPIQIEYGKNTDIKFIYEGEDVEATVTIADETVTKITYEDLEQSGRITFKPVASGDTTLTIVFPESENYEEKTVTVNAIVTPASANLEVAEEEINFIYGGANQNVTFVAPKDLEVKVESADTNIATATINGNKISIAPKGVGTTTVTLSSETTNQYLADSVTITVTVKPRPVILDWGSRNFNYDGTPKTITATITNIVLGDTVIIEEYTGNSATEIGTYLAKATKLSNSNYTLVGGSNIETEWVIGILTPPDIVVRQDGLSVPSGRWASGDVTVEVQPINGAGSDIGYEYSYDGIKWYEYKGIFTYKDETMGQKIYSRAYSKITGVSAAENGEYLLKLDKNDPDITLESATATNVVDGIINKNATITIRLNITDNYSGVEDGEFTVDDVKVLAIYKGETKELFDVTKVLVEDAGNSSKENGTYGYTLTLSNITENGRIAIRFDEKAVNDRATRYNKQKTLNINFVADNIGPEVGIIQTSADEYDRLFSDLLELSIEAKDESGIKSYEWQVSNDGVNWDTFLKDTTAAEISEVEYTSLESGIHHFRVIVTDIIGNSTTSETASININVIINRKPTIRFETEQVEGTRVKIIIIVKSTKQIETIKLNASEIDKSKWNTVKTNNEITVTTEHIAVSNGTYTCTVIDEVGNEVTETLNITTIDTNAAIITYDTYDATEYSPATIKFIANEDVRIKKIINLDGTTKNILNKDDYTGMKFDTVSFSSKVNVKLENMTFEKGTTFVFENKSFIETYVIIDKDIETKIMYVRSANEGVKYFDEIFGDTFDNSKAEVLINHMSAKTKVIYGRVTSYYGVSDSSIKLKLTEADELKAISYLAAETNTGETLKINEYGDIEKIKPTIIRNTGGDNMTFTNGNITGIKNFGNILEWTGTGIKNSFRITIRAR